MNEAHWTPERHPLVGRTIPEILQHRNPGKHFRTEIDDYGGYDSDRVLWCIRIRRGQDFDKASSPSDLLVNKVNVGDKENKTAL